MIQHQSLISSSFRGTHPAFSPTHSLMLHAFHFLPLNNNKEPRFPRLWCLRTQMFGGTGSVHWGRRDGDGHGGIVVLFAWVSLQDRHLSNYVDLYSSLGWNSLVCRPDFLNAYYPDRATSLAFILLNELVEELRQRPRPLVFVTFSAASKACIYKVFQILEGTSEDQLYMNEYRIVKICVSGHIYDSSPVEFTSDLGARFSLHPTILKMVGSSKLVSWIAKGVASGLNTIYVTRLDLQHSEYWKSLNSSVGFGAPFLFLCSEKDSLAPYHIIRSFNQRIQELGAEAEVVEFSSSPHVGHYKTYPIQYKSAVSSLLEKATSVYSERISQLKGEIHDEMSELICDLQNAAVNSNWSLTRVAVGPGDHFFLPSSEESKNDGNSPSFKQEQKERSNYVSSSSSPGISAHSVLGEILFDVCVPKNIEGWDIKFCSSLNGQPHASAHRRSPKCDIKGVRRSRL